LTITGTIVQIVSAFWIVSEILLARLKHSGTASAGLDRFSLRILWTTIILSVSGGVTLGVQGTGYVRAADSVAPWIGLSLILIGLGIRWTAILTLRRYFTVNVSIHTDHEVVTSGIYRFVRHPAYSGSVLSFLGLGMTFSSWLSTLVIFVPILGAFLYRIGVEEQALMMHLGKEYAQYSKSTRRLIPGIY